MKCDIFMQSKVETVKMILINELTLRSMFVVLKKYL